MSEIVEWSDCPDCLGYGVVHVLGGHGDTDTVLCLRCNPDEAKRTVGIRSLTAGRVLASSVSEWKAEPSCEECERLRAEITRLRDTGDRITRHLELQASNNKSLPVGYWKMLLDRMTAAGFQPKRDGG